MTTMSDKVNLTRPYSGKTDCWRIGYSRDTGAVFIVETYVFEWIQTFKNRPMKLCKLLEPVFAEYVERKANGSLS